MLCFFQANFGKISFFTANFRKISIFLDKSISLVKHFSLSRQICHLQLHSGEISHESHHLRTYLLYMYMIRYNNVSQFHATPMTPAKNLGVATLPTSRIDAHVSWVVSRSIFTRGLFTRSPRTPHHIVFLGQGSHYLIENESESLDSFGP